MMSEKRNLLRMGVTCDQNEDDDLCLSSVFPHAHKIGLPFTSPLSYPSHARPPLADTRHLRHSMTMPSFRYFHIHLHTRFHVQSLGCFSNTHMPPSSIPILRASTSGAVANLGPPSGSQ